MLPPIQSDQKLISGHQENELDVCDEEVMLTMTPGEDGVDGSGVY